MALIGLFGEVDFPEEACLGQTATALRTLKSSWGQRGVNAFSTLPHYKHEWRDSIRLYLEVMIALAEDVITAKGEWDRYLQFLKSLDSPGEPCLKPFIPPPGGAQRRVSSLSLDPSNLAGTGAGKLLRIFLLLFCLTVFLPQS